ncbi:MULTISPECIES: FtsW/RodA/SpoVE family cell cycle protein [Psychrobacter]|uniref:FtsW/RodA/SpoVE family cell cycle protein n=1 Tax=Psychrobacter TaxID=497 RepID=UPI001D0F9210|nr:MULTISPECIES: putative peptidoglycan glycosyltransferase FtsW [Psychrobacter]MDA5134133.1 putative peptidoglycan glycosyltransferase FtsW [Psychrobacter sp. ANT_H3]MDX1786522.1 putative peptidoglycan glycosyltransferase FtsW [Psychrobacter sp.]WGV13047.1 putative peptidoglycan glycosyltransferase FtsW [Psychrobacter sp. WB2]
MALSSLFRSNSQSPQATGSDGILSMPSARAILLSSVGCMLVLSLLMVASASIPFALSRGMSELNFFYNQLLYMGIGLFIAGFSYKLVSLKRLYRTETQFMLLAITGLLLFATLFSTPINGSKRWLTLGGFNFQVAELAKLVMIIFVSDFVVRRSFEVRNGWDGFLRIAIVVGLITVLLLAQPDFGSFVVIIGTVFAIFYIAGAPYKQFIALGAVAVGGAVLMVATVQYRLVRVMSFLDPFDDVQDTDYQLARSLIAFGRGQFTGVGYGESVQKLSHLPEAHTDFLLAITGEELGFVGVTMILILEALIIGSAMRISYNALKRRQMRMSYTAFGIAVVFIAQTIINAAMNMGAIPTKGLTMPFFSYGGSSMLISLVMVAVLLKIYKESPEIEKSQCRYY